ncbi:MAG: valine--tRNA ligase [Euryarchaeota archaeon]|nr:valine--tRNA ligase [Euryarchaeota archaeon]
MTDYDQRAIERKWQDLWESWKLHRFNFESSAPVYSIDVPPRYANAPLHLGHATSYTHIDIRARYKRMRGFNVFNPLCADTNGMPIEIAVEKAHNITKRSLPRQEYLKLCTQFANMNIGTISQQFKMLGHSFDPTLFYQTDSPQYRRITQITFLRMLEKGLVYKGTAPVIWCPTCETAIADPEMEYKTRKGTLSQVKFTANESGEPIWVATTRPELLCTCQLAAVHPTDERYRGLVGKTIVTPVFGREVKVIEDPKVDPAFGTGVVMICSIGDSDDLEWIYKYGLKLEKGIDEQGKMTELAGKYTGMKASDAKAAILCDMKEAGLLGEQREVDQNVGTCWRCHQPVEFLQKTQWFLKTLDFKDDVLGASKKINWHPKFMEVRLTNWVNSLNRDWVISRQRYFATPIPVWECEACGAYVPAKEEQCYMDPTIVKPPMEKCPKCGSALKGCEEVFDTWMDSSISPLYNSFWMRDEKRFKKLYPMCMRPQAHEIIRTWTFYTILRCRQVTGQTPWGETMISGFIQAPDGSPMHSSLGNAIDPIPIIEEHGADAMRYFAATCNLGIDQAFQLKEVVHGRKLCTKLWNIGNLFGNEVKGKVEAKADELRIPDKWILSRYSKVVRDATEAMEECDFARALRAVEQFAWHELADHYLEMIKHRMGKKDKALHFTLYTVYLGSLKLLTPIMPHICDELYGLYFAKDESALSITVIQWPEPLFEDPDAEAQGELVKEVISAVRTWKSNSRMPLNAALKAIEASGEGAALLLGCEQDIVGTLKAQKFVITEELVAEEKVTAVKLNLAVLGPKLRDKVGKVAHAVSALDPQQAADAVESGHLIVELPGGEKFEVGKGDLLVTKGLSLAGKEVNEVKVRNVTMLIEV